jgi:hypothetical protein
MTRASSLTTYLEAFLSELSMVVFGNWGTTVLTRLCICIYALKD